MGTKIRTIKFVWGESVALTPSLKIWVSSNTTTSDQAIFKKKKENSNEIESKGLICLRSGSSLRIRVSLNTS